MERWIVGKDDADTLVTRLKRLHEQQRRGLVVCFDYFDTLVTRTVDPEYTKVLASGLLQQALQLDLGADRLYGMRSTLERELTAKNAERYGELDFRLDHFAAAFLPVLRRQHGGLDTVTPDDFTALLLDIEVAVEKAVQRLCPEVVAVAERLR